MKSGKTFMGTRRVKAGLPRAFKERDFQGGDAVSPCVDKNWLTLGNFNVH
jgi:hypothetical protein